jgi:hypothetical protein
MLTHELEAVVGVGEEVEIGGVLLTLVPVGGEEVLVTVTRADGRGD